MELLNTNDLKVVEIKKYDHNVKKFEYEANSKRTIIIKKEDKYVNFFDNSISLPLAKRVPYSNDYHGVDFGTMIATLSPLTESGECYLLVEDEKFKTLLEKENLERKDIEEYVIERKYQFVDAVDIAKKKLQNKEDVVKMITFLKDEISNKELIDLLITPKEKTEQKHVKVKKI